MTTKDILMIANNDYCMERLKKLAELSKDADNHREEIEILSIQIHNEIVTEKNRQKKY